MLDAVDDRGPDLLPAAPGRVLVLALDLVEGRPQRQPPVPWRLAKTVLDLGISWIAVRSSGAAHLVEGVGHLGDRGRSPPQMVLG